MLRVEKRKREETIFEEKQDKSLKKETSTIGIYWGTFDPPTLAHKDIVTSAIENLNLKKLIIVINDNSTIKKSYKTPGKYRTKMFSDMLMTEKNRNQIYIVRQTDAFAWSYEKAKELFPTERIVAIVGQDSFNNFKNYIEKLKEYDQVVVIPRSDQQATLKQDIQQLGLTNTSILPINQEYSHTSSTKVRESVAQGQEAYLTKNLSPLTHNLIKERGFFKEKYEAKHHLAAEVFQHAWRRKHKK